MNIDKIRTATTAAVNRKKTVPQGKKTRNGGASRTPGSDETDSSLEEY